MPIDGAMTFQIIIFSFMTVSLLLQYLNLYRSVWWLPHSYNNNAMVSFSKVFLTCLFLKKDTKISMGQSTNFKFWRVPTIISQIWLKLFEFIYAFPDSVEKFYRFQQGLSQNLKFVPWPLDIILSFFKHEHVNIMLFIFFFYITILNLL